MEQALLHGFCAGLIGFAFAHVMAGKPGPWSWYFDRVYQLPKMIGYPLGACESCLSGQLALWTAWYACGFELRYSVACSVLTSAAAAIVIAYMLNETVLWLRK